MHSFGRSDRKSIVTLTCTTNPSISLALRAMSEAGSEMQGPPELGALVKLLEGFHSPCTACIRLVEWRDRKSIVTLLTRKPTHQFLACVPRMSEGRE
jgi:hypothetical protein